MTHIGVDPPDGERKQQIQVAGLDECEREQVAQGEEGEGGGEDAGLHGAQDEAVDHGVRAPEAGARAGEGDDECCYKVA